MPTTEDFLLAAQWVGIGTLASIVFTILCFLFKWGFRFRFVGVSSFMVVLTVSLFSLSFIPFTQTVVPGSAPYEVVFDNGATHTVIAVSPEITAAQLEATLQQAALKLFSYGRSARGDDRLTVLARTMIHPQPQVSEPVYLGKIERSLDQSRDQSMLIEINIEKLKALSAQAPS